MAKRSKILSRHAVLVIAMGSLLLLSGCALLLNNVREVGVGEQYRVSPHKAVLLYGGQFQQPLPSNPQFRGFGLDLDEYDAVAGKSAGNCWRYNHTNSVVKEMGDGTPTFFASVVDPGYFVRSGFSAIGWKSSDAPAFYAAPGTISYVGVYTYNSEKDTFEVRRDLGEGQEAAKRFPGLSGPVVLAPMVPAHGPGFFVCAP